MSECIEHQGYKPRGYGRRSSRHGTPLAHRQAWIDEHGPIADGLEVMHLCNNKACINVEHLRLGTHAENMAMAARDGLLTGAVRGRTVKLTQRQRVAVRHMHRCGMTQQAIADFFGVSQTGISYTIRGGQ